MDVVALARAEREDLLDLLLALIPEQERAPSPCAGWTVAGRRGIAAELTGPGRERIARPLAARAARTVRPGGRRRSPSASLPPRSAATPSSRPPRR
ncbi:hypothetical protein SAMN05660350_01673 [Geodermatophilus obscurus]|uniref:Mycothiol-dependent maleylpyruvate isomerase metal-binding domain-containing protein n=1 Tax=Geodermatophilus obscurus TaxID=1861 RepID=A0A1M7TFS1_9ACTN|nr:hypothetical protein SAMN05660350_01673 [Geodermatophilus obscurus]